MHLLLRGMAWFSAFLAACMVSHPLSSMARDMPVEAVAPGCQVVRGPVNGFLIEKGGKTLAVYGDPREECASVDTVLFTHHRRDVVWAGSALVAAGARAVVPDGDLTRFTEPDKFWAAFQTKRFHDYQQQTTKVPIQPIQAAQVVRGGDAFTWQGIPVRVLDTPGYTRGAVTYLMEPEGRKLAFTGDLIYGDGRLLDLYSLQDTIPSAKIGGYHGYAARLGEVVASLRKVAAEKPDLIVPARGPLIRNPAQAIQTLLDRIQAFYANYLSIDALRWYFKDDHIRAKAKRVLGPETAVPWMGMAETVRPLPDWVVPIANSRLILASDGAGFLVDCGSQGILNQLKKLQAEGKLTSIAHLFVTHYHDDHTDQVSKAVDQFGCTVHASRENWDILEHPEAYRMPCLTRNPIHVSGRHANGAHWRWKEFDITLYYFPGQTLQHDALLVRKQDGETVFFIGDSFTPSGIDDYCLLNRNFLHEGTGYFYCLDLVQRVAPEALLVNQHVEPAFRFSSEQIERMRSTLQRRIGLLRELMPWEDPNFGLDEGWARFHPYALPVAPGDALQLSLRIMNHSAAAELFQVRLPLPEGWVLVSQRPDPIRIPARTEGAVAFQITIPKNAAAGTHILAADLRWDDWDLRQWTEAMVTVRRTASPPTEETSP